MSNENRILTILIEGSEAEIRDLKRFWNDLSWWERDESIEAALNFSRIIPISLENGPDELKKRRDKVLEDITKLHALNAKVSPSKLRIMLHLVPYEGRKPNLSICIHTIYKLPIDDLIDLGKYLCVERIDSFREHPNDLYKLYWDIGNDSSRLAIFFALRNYLGKRYI